MKKSKQNKNTGVFTNKVKTEVEAYTPDFILNNVLGYNVR
jgi:hypothetical protein